MTRSNAEYPGALWSSTESSGVFRSSWSSLEFLEYAGVRRSSSEFAGVCWSSLEFAGVRWSSLELAGVRWSSLVYAGVPWSSWSSLE